MSELILECKVESTHRPASGASYTAKQDQLFPGSKESAFCTSLEAEAISNSKSIHLYLYSKRTYYQKGKNLLGALSPKTAWLILLGETYSHHEAPLSQHQIQKQRSAREEDGPGPGAVTCCRLSRGQPVDPYGWATHFQLTVSVASLLQTSISTTRTSSTAICSTKMTNFVSS